MNSLKSVKSLNDQDLLVLGRIMTRVGIPTSSEIWVSLSNQEKGREAKHFSSEDLKCPIYRPHGLSAPASSVEKRAHLRHLLRLENRDGFPLEPCEGENVSLIKGTYGALKKGNILPWKRVNRRISSPVSAREGENLPWKSTHGSWSRESDRCSKANISSEAQMRGY